MRRGRKATVVVATEVYQEIHRVSNGGHMLFLNSLELDFYMRIQSPCSSHTATIARVS